MPWSQPMPKRTASRRVYRQREAVEQYWGPTTEPRPQPRPLTEAGRAERYLAQSPGRTALTARQWRRIDHKSNHANAPFGAAEADR